MARKSKKRESGSGTIYKKKDGLWAAQYTSGRDPKTGKLHRHTIYGKTQKEVAEKLRQATTSIDNQTFQEPSKITFAEYAAEFMMMRSPMISPNTVYGYQKILDAHLLPAFGRRKLTELTHREVQAFVSSLVAKTTLEPKTIHNIHGLLHRILEAAIHDEILVRNVSSHCDLPKAIKKEPKVFSSEDLDHFVQIIDPLPRRLLYLFDIFSGLRASEVLGLTWENVDFDNNSIFVGAQLMKKPGRDKDGYYLKIPKEEKQRRIILAPTVMAILRAQHTNQMKDRMAVGPLWENRLNLVFTNELGGPLNRRTVYKHLKKALIENGLPDYKLHTLRHSFATISLENGDDIKTVQTNLGHYDPAFTLRTYVHASKAMQKASADRMEKLAANMNFLP